MQLNISKEIELAILKTVKLGFCYLGEQTFFFLKVIGVHRDLFLRLIVGKFNTSELLIKK